MSNPFFIWTFQRTGGTSLATALFDESKFQAIDHEPFNGERSLGEITKNFRRKNVEQAGKMLDRVLEKRPLIKHCFELHDFSFNNELVLKLSHLRDYRHIVLVRKDEVSRLFSLFLAKQTDVWGKGKAKSGGYEKFASGQQTLNDFPVDQMIKHGAHCAMYLDWLLKKMQSESMNYKIVYFEDLYVGDMSEKSRKVNSVFDFVGLSNVDLENDTVLSERILKGSQGSSSLYDLVPNAQEAREALDDFFSCTRGNRSC
ncbi:hypothetical protein PVT68_16715 [Microbulbifer bruguierae]|uniref:Stf0 sulfotransferase n=1 Tax=Microbulbifer bruguierae TaxID=3029061 RepID=A0ABY8NBU6_9GAMM|nr:hypothetical protein [Microbulbifer bruguierae]WGL16394.1 hypothetical protein PVT68_16715 [Microbulbifer bruguierae]